MKADFSRLKKAFEPECVAVVGDSKRNNFGWLKAQSTFKGRLYSVQVNPETIAGIEALGVKNYTSLTEIPEPVDLAVVAVPRAVAIRVLDDCVEKGVAAVHLFTAGFSETDTEEGNRFEQELIERAERGNLQVIGPNCLGVFNPGIGLRQSEDQYADVTGPVGLISQSGHVALSFSFEAHLQGIDISRSVSFGNGTVIDGVDYLEYFGQDPAVKIIAMYLEGVKNGKRFIEALKDVSARKPVLIWKGGRTEDGEKAIAAHTGSMAVPRHVWDNAIKQQGAMSVTSMEELIDTIKALHFLPPVTGDRVGVAGGSGGQSVLVADVFYEQGLRVPQLTRGSYDELASFFVLIGGGYPNPIDTGGNVNRLEIRRIMDILNRDRNIDNLVMIVSMKPGRSITLKQAEETIHMLEDLKKETDKPIMVMVYFSTPAAEQEARPIMLKFQEKGIPAFSTIERCARALKNAHELNNRPRRPPMAAGKGGTLE
ncbi:MAG: CoA-binding protein [Deltaproteobacteria bacterium]|nr:CoA-binding protein [Deltaproteobacteria bacterium]